VSLSAYHYVQLLLAFAVLCVAILRLRQVFGLKKLDVGSFLRSLERRQRAGDEDGVGRLLEGAGDSWAGRVARAAVKAGEGDPEEPTVDELLSDQRYETSRHLLTLRVAVSLGSMSGLLGALLEYLHLPAARHSLLGLMPGLPEKRALEGATIAVGIGVAIAIVAGLALRSLRRRAKALYADSLEIAARLEKDAE